MDDLDRKILQQLQQNSRVTNLKLAQSVHLAPSAVLKRVRNLERLGVISGYTARLNHRRLGLDLTVLIDIETSEKPGVMGIGGKLAAFPEICSVYDVSGHSDYIIKVVVRDTEALNDLISRLGRIPGVLRTRTALVMRTIKNELSPEPRI